MFSISVKDGLRAWQKKEWLNPMEVCCITRCSTGGPVSRPACKTRSSTQALLNSFRAQSNKHSQLRFTIKNRRPFRTTFRNTINHYSSNSDFKLNNFNFQYNRSIMVFLGIQPLKVVSEFFHPFFLKTSDRKSVV